MKSAQLVFLLSIILLMACSSPRKGARLDDTPMDHSAWTTLLQKHVDEEGLVDYQGFMSDSTALNQYLDSLSANFPNPKTWSDNERLAYWINVYNAFTVKLILMHYPMESIKDIKAVNITFVNTPWTIKFFEIGGKKMNLDMVEHRVIRKYFDEPRIHFAVNCASTSCPKLRDEAFVADSLDEQLDDQARDFINDTTRNLITDEEVKLSKILKWYSGDFPKPITEYINQYSTTPIPENAEINYMNYDWGLNEQ